MRSSTAALTTSATVLAPVPGLFNLAGVARVRELTRKDQRLSSGLVPLDRLPVGRLACGRITEIVARGFGWLNIPAAFLATVTRRGEAAAWIDPANAFAPANMAAASVDLKGPIRTLV
jgi:hypothetical protein